MSKKLLLADDSVTIQKVVEITFANEDYDLTVVDNGDAALEKARSDRPDLILADVYMPGKNGYELCAALKQDPSFSGVPVLLLTGTFEPFDEGKARQAGADSWIAKPFESQALIDRVEELLAKVPEPAGIVEAPPEMVISGESPLEDASSESEADIWEDLIEPAAAEGGAPEPVSEDPWGSVSFDEEDLEEEPAQASVEDIWGGLDEDVSRGQEPATDSLRPLSTEPEGGGGFTGAAPPEASEPEVSWGGQLDAPSEQEKPFAFEAQEAPASFPEAVMATEDSQWEESEEEILCLDESDILEEEDLEFEEEFPAAETTPMPEGLSVGEPFRSQGVTDLEPAAEEEAFSFRSEEPLATEEPEEIVAETPPAEGPWGNFAETEPGPLVEEESFIFEAEPSPAAEEPSVASDAARSESVATFFEPRESESATAPAEAARVEEKVRALTEEEISRIVEKVAGAVVERLANAILEKIAWEVVPDLAESMIREEIRQIKEGVE